MTDAIKEQHIHMEKCSLIVRREILGNGIPFYTLVYECGGGGWKASCEMLPEEVDSLIDILMASRKNEGFWNKDWKAK